MRILLVRHGESQANVDRRILKRQPDHSVGLTNVGRQQAERAGIFLGKWFIADGMPAASPLWWTSRHTVTGKFPFRLWVSPYQRTRETADVLLEAMLKDSGAVPESGRREHVALAEQQYGLFDGLSDEELAEQFPKEFGHYKLHESFEGRYWSRYPMGESRYDVSLRVHESFGTFRRDEEKHGIETIVIVAHGTTNRAFLQQWLHHPWEWFESEPNPANCSIRLIDNKEDKGYIYQGG